VQNQDKVLPKQMRLQAIPTIVHQLAKGAMRAFGVVVSAPFFDYYLRFLQRVEYLPVQQFVSQAGVEALNVTVLPW
jgi:hypothetical protein